MLVRIKTRKGEESVELPAHSTIKDALKKMDINDETVLIKLNAALAHPSHALHEGDSLELVHIIFGG